jgi:hypothetical protein
MQAPNGSEKSHNQIQELIQKLTPSSKTTSEARHCTGNVHGRIDQRVLKSEERGDSFLYKCKEIMEAREMYLKPPFT